MANAFTPYWIVEDYIPSFNISFTFSLTSRPWNNDMSQLSSLITEISQVGQARREAVLLAKKSGFNESYVGKIALIATELGTNLVKHATSGQLLMRVSEPHEGNHFEFLSLDRGPGMAEVSKCLA